MFLQPLWTILTLRNILNWRAGAESRVPRVCLYIAANFHLEHLWEKKTFAIVDVPTESRRTLFYLCSKWTLTSRTSIHDLHLEHPMALADKERLFIINFFYVASDWSMWTQKAVHGCPPRYLLLHILISKIAPLSTHFQTSSTWSSKKLWKCSRHRLYKLCLGSQTFCMRLPAQKESMHKPSKKGITSCLWYWGCS